MFPLFLAVYLLTGICPPPNRDDFVPVIRENIRLPISEQIPSYFHISISGALNWNGNLELEFFGWRRQTLLTFVFSVEKRSIAVYNLFKDKHIEDIDYPYYPVGAFTFYIHNSKEKIHIDYVVPDSTHIQTLANIEHPKHGCPSTGYKRLNVAGHADYLQLNITDNWKKMFKVEP